MPIYLSNSTRRPIDQRALERTAEALLRAAGAEAASLSIALVGDAAIRRLNRRFRWKDRATDVLSFGTLDRGPKRRRSRGRRSGARARGLPEHSLGDVVISLDRAARQAARYDATLEREVRRLLIHGILHLLGHDHQAPRERARMVREERRLATAIGLPWPYDEGVLVTSRSAAAKRMNKTRSRRDSSAGRT